MRLDVFDFAHMKFKLLPSLLLTSSLIISCIAESTVEPVPVTQELIIPSATTVDLLRNTVYYSESDDPLQNPERGFATDADLDDLDYLQYYDDEYTLVYSDIRLDPYRESDIPDEFLHSLDESFSAMRLGGVKTIVRFSYNDGPYPNPEPDASLEWIQKHIHRVQPVLQRNADVIAWLEAGFIGAWGEWHTSTHGLDSDSSAKQQILYDLLDAIPNRAVLLRYPMDIMTMFPTPLNELNAFTAISQARVGFHNDCFLSSVDDEHTYGRRGVFSVSSEMDYLTQTTRFVPVGGESCSYNPPRSDCMVALSELSRLHFSELNDGWYPDVLDAWDEQGCYSEIQDRLGYRFSLVSMTINEQVRPGGVLNMDLQIKNSGFGVLFNPRTVYAVLDGPGSYRTALTMDPRFWAPGIISSFQVNLRVPADALEGMYTLSLWLPDPSNSLEADPRYAIRFANLDVWDADTALNKLQDIEISSYAGGKVDPDANQFMEIP